MAIVRRPLEYDLGVSLRNTDKEMVYFTRNNFIWATKKGALSRKRPYRQAHYQSTRHKSVGIEIEGTI
jgi:hypothetical protein